MGEILEIGFTVKQCSNGFECVTFLEIYCWNMDMCKSELSQSYEIRARHADFWKVHNKPRAFNYYNSKYYMEYLHHNI